MKVPSFKVDKLEMPSNESDEAELPKKKKKSKKSVTERRLKITRGQLKRIIKEALIRRNKN